LGVPTGMEGQLLLGTLMIVATVVFHALGLVHLAKLLKRMALSLEFIGATWSHLTLLVVTVLTIIAIHAAESLGWAYLFCYLGEFAELNRAMYFSVVTSTTLGYGDVTLSEQWQLLGSFEAIGGLILFGASTAFLFGVTLRLFEEKPISGSP
jgi:voltage-gated potassium channel Kch